jgi:hypothetical protein
MSAVRKTIKRTNKRDVQTIISSKNEKIKHC